MNSFFKLIWWARSETAPPTVKMCISITVAQNGFGNSPGNEMCSFTRPHLPHLPPVLTDKTIRQPDWGGGGLFVFQAIYPPSSTAEPPWVGKQRFEQGRVYTAAVAEGCSQSKQAGEPPAAPATGPVRRITSARWRQAAVAVVSQKHIYVTSAYATAVHIKTSSPPVSTPTVASTHANAPCSASGLPSPSCEGSLCP